MDRNVTLALLVGLYSLCASSRSEMDYCLRESSIIYDSPKGVFLVDFKQKLAEKKLEIPSEIAYKVQRSNGTNILECDQTKFRIINENTAHEFNFDKKENLEFVKSHPYKTSKSMRSLGDLTRGNKVELYKNDKFKVHYEPNEQEEAPKEYEGTVIMHHFTNKLIKTDLTSGKQIEELVIFKGSREETID